MTMTMTMTMMMMTILTPAVGHPLPSQLHHTCSHPSLLPALTCMSSPVPCSLAPQLVRNEPHPQSFHQKNSTLIFHTTKSNNSSRSWYEAGCLGDRVTILYLLALQHPSSSAGSAPALSIPDYPPPPTLHLHPSPALLVPTMCCACAVCSLCRIEGLTPICPYCLRNVRQIVTRESHNLQ